MVWQCKSDNEAAAIVGMNVLAIRIALGKPHVRAYFRQQRQVLQEREGPANIFALISVRDGDNQMARVAAVKALEQLSEESTTQSRGSVALPGLTIQILNAPASMPPIRETEAKPLITQGDVRSEE